MGRGPSQRHGTVENFQMNCWSNINHRTVNGRKPYWQHPRMVKFYLSKGIRLRMTREEFYAWCSRRKRQIESIYMTGESPSIDRIDPKGHYEILNIRILTHRENSRRATLLGNMRRIQRANTSCTPKRCIYCNIKMERKQKSSSQRSERVAEFKARKLCSQQCKMAYINSLPSTQMNREKQWKRMRK